MSVFDKTDRRTVATIAVEAGALRDHSYPTASWYRDFEYDAQTVDVRLSGNFVVYSLQGRTTFESFPSSFGGHQTGMGTHGPVDRPSTYTVQQYRYNAAAAVEAGRMGLVDGASIVERFVDHRVYCSGSSTVYADGLSTAVDCGCSHHVDMWGENDRSERKNRGFLVHGYRPDVVERKRHIDFGLDA